MLLSHKDASGIVDTAVQPGISKLLMKSGTHTGEYCTIDAYVRPVLVGWLHSHITSQVQSVFYQPIEQTCSFAVFNAAAFPKRLPEYVCLLVKCLLYQEGSSSELDPVVCE